MKYKLKILTMIMLTTMLSTGASFADDKKVSKFFLNKDKDDKPSVIPIQTQNAATELRESLMKTIYGGIKEANEDNKNPGSETEKTVRGTLFMFQKPAGKTPKTPML